MQEVQLTEALKEPLARGPAKSLGERARGLSEEPAFYLVYLLFYFSPWFFERPSLNEALIGVAAAAGFIPVYLFCYGASGFQCGIRPHRAALGAAVASALALGLAPLNGMSGTFHIYATTLVAGLRPRWRSLAAAAGLGVVYVSAASWIGVSIFEIAICQFIAIMAGLGTMASYDSVARTEVRERALRLEAELATVRERERIARDLHDVLGHTLTTIAVKSELAAKLLDQDAAKARQEIIEIRDASRETLRQVRAAVADMQVTTVGDEIDRARSALATASVELQVEGEAPALDARGQTALGLAVREAVTNIIRHSEARRVTIRFGPGSHVTIEDDGGGDLTEGSGLIGMRRRIEALGGAMTARGGPSGVSIALQLPPAAESPAS